MRPAALSHLSDRASVAVPRNRRYDLARLHQLRPVRLASLWIAGNTDWTVAAMTADFWSSYPERARTTRLRQWRRRNYDPGAPNPQTETQISVSVGATVKQNPRAYFFFPVRLS